MKKNLTKDVLKSRILKNAAQFWGISNVDLLDPVVTLLLESLANEVFKIHQEVRAAEGKLLLHLAGLLAPADLCKPLSSHSVMQVRSIETATKLDIDKVFIVDGLKGLPDLQFVPVIPATIFNAVVHTLVTPLAAYRIRNSLHKEVLTVSNRHTDLSQQVWIGLQIDPSISDIAGMSFFIDWPGMQCSESLYQMMSIAEWYLGTEKLKVAQGLITAPSSNVLPESLDDIVSFYKTRFITLSQDASDLSTSYCRYPPSFVSFFSDDTLDQHFKENKLWIKIVFPLNYSDEVLDGILINVNCFPVINKHRHTTNSRMSIIPLDMPEHEELFDIETVYTKTGKIYAQHLTGIHPMPDMIGTYTVSNGRLEQFDMRNAREHLDYLLEVMKEETRIFTAMKVPDIASRIDKISHLLKEIEMQMEEFYSEPLTTLQYLLVNTSRQQESFFVEYWTTAHINANNLRPGTPLKELYGADCQPGQLILLTTSLGGRAALDHNSRLTAYRYALTSNNRIVTRLDVENFIYMELGGLAADVGVKPGVMVSESPTEGLVRCTDVFITLNVTPDLHQQLPDLKNMLSGKLAARSGLLSRYRIVWVNVFIGLLLAIQL